MSRRTCVLLLLLGALIQAFGICNIHVYSVITEGGVLGMTLLLHHFLGLSPAISSVILNACCYLYGIHRLGKTFLIRSCIASLSYALFYALLEPFAPMFPSILVSPLLCALLGALSIGIGAGLCVLAGGATCGDDALAMGLSHALSCDIRLIYLVSDGLVLLLTLTYVPFREIFYSLLTVLLSGQIIGIMQKLFGKSHPRSAEQPSGGGKDRPQKNR